MKITKERNNKMKITKKQLKQIIKEEFEKVIAENVPNPDFMRRSHGGKTCEEWNKEISELKAAYQEEDELLQAMFDSMEDYSAAVDVEQQKEKVKTARNAWSAARNAAEHQKCPVHRNRFD